MSGPDHHRLLSSLLNRLRFSLLQYVGESWTWTPDSSADRLQQLQGLIQRQQFAAGRIADLLSDREAVITVDNYPRDCSALHFVSVDYAKPKLIADEEAIVSALRSAAKALADDAEALRLVEQIASDEAVTLETLRKL